MEHYIELIDGKRIEAFLRPIQPEPVAEEELTLDTTGKYLMKDKARSQQQNATYRDKSDRMRLELFLRNANRLIEASNKILSDSRIFLTPLPITSGLAYTGTSGFQNPTLGIYIEWWKNNECAWTLDKSGVKRPIYHISGSPLSGTNSCGYVGAEGENCHASIRSFSSVWSSFININTRYVEAKQRYDAYTLEDVLKILFD
jgi:hypothetical protein